MTQGQSLRGLEKGQQADRTMVINGKLNYD
jgi:hypothetical protein